MLMGFFNRMQGRFKEFCFECAGAVHPRCRFDSDSPFTPSDVHNATLPVQLLQE
jgi:hypothetical protein